LNTCPFLSSSPSAAWRRGAIALAATCGVTFPDDFVPLAENTPLSGLLTYWVIDRVAIEMGDWLRKQDGVEMHINVPPRSSAAADSSMPRRNQGSMTCGTRSSWRSRTGVPDQLGLHAIDLALARAFRIALDDVRIDPASVMVLSRCNAQIIKIDKSVLLDNGASGALPRWPKLCRCC